MNRIKTKKAGFDREVLLSSLDDLNILGSFSTLFRVFVNLLLKGIPRLVVREQYLTQRLFRVQDRVEWRN